MGDFNAKLGKKGNKKAIVMGNFEIGNRNERRRMIIGFTLKRNLQITNSLFYKKKLQKMGLERTE